MTTLPVTLRGPLAVVPVGKSIEALEGQPARFVAELTELSARGMLPARVEPDRDDPNRGRLVVYTSRHVATLYPTKFQDGYTLGYARRRTFRDEDRLVVAALALHCPSGWRVFDRVQDLPRGRGAFDQPWSSQWADLRGAWARLPGTANGSGSTGGTGGTGTVDVPGHTGTPGGQHPGPGERLAPRHQRYLDLVSEVIEASRDIEVARQELAPPLPYARREAAREQRYSGRGVYAFHLARPGSVVAGAQVQVSDSPSLRGRVDRVDGREVVVRFDQAVDFQALPAQGELRVLPSDRVYKIQQAAVDTLAEGTSANPNLLANLVDGVFLPYQPAAGAHPRGPLDDNQLTAFRRALTVPDLLVVLGPPGTGKTRTITEIVLACVARGETVLVTSHTNRAVDNVLAGLPSDVHAVRIGSETSMTAAARTRTVDSLLESFRRDVLADTRLPDLMAAFERAEPVLRQWLDHLTERCAVAGRTSTELAAAERALDEAILAASPELAAARRQAVRDADGILDTMSALDERLAAAHAEVPARQSAAERRGAAGLLRWWHAWRLTRLRSRVDRALAARAAAETDLARIAETRDQLRAQAAALAAADPACAARTADRDDLAATIAECHRDLADAGKVILGALLPLLTAPGPANLPASDDLAGWQTFHAWAVEAIATVRARAALLAQWRARIGDAETELRHELVRYAQVVAATCVGTASSPLLADIVFDVAIIDEAGQISTPNMLVPMVRARRSVLVGDHHQLPPFLDDEVRLWSESLAPGGPDAGGTGAGGTGAGGTGAGGAGTDGVRADGVRADDAREIGDLLRASGFERLFPRVGDERRVELTLQRRMPEVLARFVSDAFYHGRLRTSHDGGGGDPIFRSPLAMIDTADRPPAQRAERELRAAEPWQLRGYVNELEAELIAAHVARAARYFADWAVIVPYRAQAARIEAALGRRLGDPARVSENVGTVDSFQGGERDLIVYGFTRSNDRGAVGFLSELRRLNVAITRAKQQLVLVGDTSTLCAATDPPFATMARNLVDHLRSHGDLRPSREIAHLLSDADDTGGAF
ncbi:AAA+ ATPase domain-containing protein [Frankia sp. AiPs1]|uniref:AAA domain-containing protein n=1 Tax=Frankia sp. AiPa1 TaxID=573492 RepID=UPI00202AE8F3|nr:AAA domain-containing protein [Frankia sp. AiPa1]MCL9760942.1 AAA domain-containing protein [Frankia sp. AiPa1]